MDLYVKSDPVFIVSKNFVAENYEQDIRQELEIIPSILLGNTSNRKGLHCSVLFRQSSSKGNFFELRTTVNLYFDLALLALPLLHHLLRLAQQYSIDEFFEQAPVDREKFIIAVQQLDKNVVQALYEKLKRDL